MNGSGSRLAGAVHEATKKKSMMQTLRRTTTPLKKNSLWADSIIRSSVLDSEIAKPGGLEGGPGEIKPSDIHALLETRWGRQLTAEEKRFATQRLSYNIMQLEPPSMVRPYLYLGNAYNAVNFIELKSLGITHVLNLCAPERFDPPQSYETNSICCHRIKLVDAPTQEILPYFDECLGFLKRIRKSGGVCLVHCEYGVSRSGTVVLAALMAFEHINFKRALEVVHARPSGPAERRLLACAGVAREASLHAVRPNLSTFERCCLRGGAPDGLKCEHSCDFGMDATEEVRSGIVAKVPLAVEHHGCMPSRRHSSARLLLHLPLSSRLQRRRDRTRRPPAAGAATRPSAHRRKQAHGQFVGLKFEQRWQAKDRG